MPYPRFHPLSELPPIDGLAVSDFACEFPAESRYTEFKQGISRRKLAEALVGFSNADGGVVLIGVTATGKVIGLDSVGERERELHDALSNVLNPGRYSVRPLRVGDSDLLVLCIERRREGFAQTSDGVILQRQGASNQPLKGAELSLFVQRRAFATFESTVTDIDWDDVPDADRENAARAWRVDVDAILGRLLDDDLLVREEGRVRLTVAGALVVFSANDEPLGRAGVQILRYTGTETEPDRREWITGTADAMVRGAERFVLDTLGKRSVRVGIKRIDMDRLPPLALRETLANAVAHRSYEARGTWTRVEIRPSGVTVRSPGTLPESVTPENIRDQQFARNPKVLGFLRRAGLAEALGLGIDRIEDEMAAELLEAPRFEEGPNWFQVHLPVSGSFAPEERAWILELRRERVLDRYDALLIVHAGRVGTVTNASAREWLALDRDETRRALRRLRDKGLLVQHGERGGTRYSLAEDLGMPSPGRLEQEARQQVVLELAGEGPVTNTLVRERLDLDRRQAVELLQSLVDSGQLVRTGEKRGTRYAIPSRPD